MCQFNGLNVSFTFLEKTHLENTQKKCMKQYIHCLKTDELIKDYGKYESTLSQVMAIDCIARKVSK